MVNSSTFDLSFWKNKRVLITGHTGFKGSWLSLWLSNLGAKLVGYSLPPPTKISLFDVVNVSSCLKSITGNIADFQNFKKVIKEHNPEIIIHMAAQSLVLKSYDEPRETFETNVMGTVNLFEAVRQVKGVKVIINITSDKCYENKEKDIAYSEADSLGGCDPYSSSKACAEHVTKAYRSSFFSSCSLGDSKTFAASVRAGNVIGGGDFAPYRLIPDIVRAVFNSTSLIVRNPDAIRPWQHVLEPLSGYILLAKKIWEEGEKYTEAWNFGPGDLDIKPVKWICERFMDQWGKKIEIKTDSKFKFYESQLLRLDCSKARTRLGWKPVWNIEEALIKTVEWYRAYSEKKNMLDITLLQIKEYEKELADQRSKMVNI